MKPIEKMKEIPGYEDWSKRANHAHRGFELRENGTHKTQVITDKGQEKGLLWVDTQEGAYEVLVKNALWQEQMMDNLETGNVYDLFVRHDAVPTTQIVEQRVRMGKGYGIRKVEKTVTGKGYYYGKFQVVDMRDSDCGNIIFTAKEVA
jgi:hypothetical protein